MPLHKMSYAKLLFSLEGRISRSTLWLKYLLPYIVIILICVVFDFVFGPVNEDGQIGLISGLATIVLFYPSIAVMVKRTHDHGYSGWLVLLIFVPVINVIYCFFLFFIPGTKDSNKYGPDPLGNQTGDGTEAG